MAQNLFVAEGVEILRQCETEEHELDQIRSRIKGGRGSGERLVFIAQRYHKLLQNCVQGMEILNHVRHTALDEANTQHNPNSRKLSEFCSQKILEFLKRCKTITNTLDSLSFPLSHVEAVRLEGYVLERPLLVHEGKRYPLKGSEKMIAREFHLSDGTYLIIIKNLDDYTFAPPDVHVELALSLPSEVDSEMWKFNFTLSCGCAWRKSVGVVGLDTLLTVKIRSSGMRESHIDFRLEKWKPAEQGPTAPTGAPLSAMNLPETGKDEGKGGGEGGKRAEEASEVLGKSPSKEISGNRWIEELPPLPDNELEALAAFNVPQAELPPRGGVPSAPPLDPSLSSSSLAPLTPPSRAQNPWAMLEKLSVPHGEKGVATEVPAPVEVRPRGRTCRERMRLLRGMLNAWPSEGVTRGNLPTSSQRLLNAVYTLPLPTEIE
ncbi:unnamed protein product [Phytomonas sp. EM1]|nr:unnamed protein product [Phytomonas sp. EM1]|eukprot:CCW61078.1 unnamed protein product [Phytomonas sp. isolate EM1]